eukprot:m.270120 g.270120  ORF g.270120 m.270120 type:complete len:1335 (-) comp19310_c1_seq6:32-4036(-)
MVVRKLSVFVPRDSDAAHTVVLHNRVNETALIFATGGHAAELDKEEFERVSSTYVKKSDIYGALGILAIPHQGAILHFLAVVTQCKSVGSIPFATIFHISAIDFLPLFEENADTVPGCLSALKKLFATGTFLFSESEVSGGDDSGTMWSKYDITRRMQEQRNPTPNLRFFWNWNMWQGLERQGINCYNWLLHVIRGHVEIRCVYVGGRQIKIALFSRLSRERTGTRFSTRGIDDEGSAANFVETEQAIFSPDNEHVVSVVMTRGSVPVFWEQPGIQVGSHKVRLSRGFEATKPAFAAHVRKLESTYGPQVFVNLLSRKEGEYMLTTVFQKHLKVGGQDVKYVPFDLHHKCKGGNREEKLGPLIHQLMPLSHDFGFYELVNGEETQTQNGAIRFNCLDCLDRTNFAQAALAKRLLDTMLSALWRTQERLTAEKCAHFQMACVELWKRSGNCISRVVSGTGALGSSGKAVGKIMDARRSVTRTIKNNFYDAAVQEAIDVLLGKAIEEEHRDEFFLPDPRLQSVFEEKMAEREAEYTTKRKLNICVGTWNVNGGKHFRSIAYKNVSMGDWLISPTKPFGDVDVYAVGFEEMVDLTAKNMVKTASKNKYEWRDALLEVINCDGIEYGLITIIQLVGVCLYLFVHPRHLDACKDVAVDSVKTGAGGKVGNKGGVAVRMRLYGTSFAFVCAHLAAGQKNIAERNQDYTDICRKIDFRKGRHIESHDYVFWCGDFNYRIDLPNDDCKELILQENWQALQKADQLLFNHERSRCFVGLQEGPLEFAPTYKYDLFSDKWDTSEKNRTPSWTDRVLFRGPDRSPKAADCEMLHYGRCDTLKMSDHRPVLALVAVELDCIDEQVRNGVRDEVLEEFRASHCTVAVHPISEALGLEELRKTFEAYGQVTLVAVEDNTGFVSFIDKQAASASLALHKAELHGTVVSVSFTELPTAYSRSTSGVLDPADGSASASQPPSGSEDEEYRGDDVEDMGDASDDEHNASSSPSRGSRDDDAMRDTRTKSLGAAELSKRRRPFARTTSFGSSSSLDRALPSRPSPQRPPPPSKASPDKPPPSRPPPPRAKAVFQAAMIATTVTPPRPSRPVSRQPLAAAADDPPSLSTPAAPAIARPPLPARPSRPASTAASDPPVPARRSSVSDLRPVREAPTIPATRPSITTKHAAEAGNASDASDASDALDASDASESGPEQEATVPAAQQAEQADHDDGEQQALGDVEAEHDEQHGADNVQAVNDVEQADELEQVSEPVAGSLRDASETEHTAPGDADDIDGTADMTESDAGELDAVVPTMSGFLVPSVADECTFDGSLDETDSAMAAMFPELVGDDDA